MKKEKNIVEQAAVPHRDKPAAALLVAMRRAAFDIQHIIFNR